MKSAAPSRVGVLALVLASVLWGTTGTAASFMPGDVSPLAVGASTMGVGGVLLFAFSARASIAAIRDSAARRWLVLGALGVFVYPLAFYSAMANAGVAIGNVVALGSGPIFAALLEWLFERHRLSVRWLVCTSVAIGGVALLASGRVAVEGAEGSLILGIALGLLAGLAYAVFTYSSTRALDSTHRGRGVMGAMFGLGALGLIPVLLATGAPLLQSTHTIGIAGYLAVGPMFAAYLLFGFGLRTIRSSAATTITLIEPLIATVLAVMVVGERLSALGWIGLALILLGVTLLVSARQTGKAATPS